MSTSLVWNNQNGTLAIDRNNLRDFYAQSLQNYLPSVCFLVEAHCEVNEIMNCTMSASIRPGGHPSLTETAGDTVLSYSYSNQSHDGAGFNDQIGSLTISTNYNMDIQFTNANNDATVLITQHLVLNYDSEMLSAEGSGNIIDKTIVETYTLTVDESGILGTTVDPVITDNSTPFENSDWNPFTGSDGFIQELRSQGDSLQQTSMLNIPLSDKATYSFPGGQNSTFKSVQFSDDQDLVASVA
ncbi:uncharacterized protein FTJAE_9313 [Fusarium tjaetaba]|uniref:Uncharacterized protein n=1 Tax=Fusarium tjaetaba TaxID=1567544 RepID=A0A8H5VM51_9HYPO|nr:uncharacterized protein FTJAE_9313 [Fusarium tjaetaba]KAF5627228.1 hypothetical protein FTJAE_9313 [Fusarium tjaetaba]